MSRPRPAVDVERLESRRMLAAQAPYLGSPFPVGATPVTIEAEHFDLGGQDVAYFDNSPGNGGGTTFRSDEDVDLKPIAGGGFRVLGTYVGEWVEYTIDVDAAGTYSLASRVSSKGSGGSFHIELRGADTGAFVSDLTGVLTIPNTGDHEEWVTLTSDVTLPAGTHVLRLAIDTNSTYGSAGNFDWMTLTQLETEPEPDPDPVDPQQPYHGIPFPVGATPVTIEAEHFDLGGQNVAYFDNSPGNGGGTTFRFDEDVDLKGITGGGYRVLGTYDDEWIEYTIDVAAAGTYTLASRVSSRGSGGSFHVEQRDAESGAFVSNLTGAITIPNTGEHENWATLTHDVTLPAGTHVLRLAIDTNSSYGSAGNFDWLKLTRQSEPEPEPDEQAPYHGVPFAVGANPVTIEAEHFDLGGQNVAYFDNSPGNGGGTTFRAEEDVDLKGIAGGGYRVLGTYDDEWIEYTIDVAAAGTYTLASRVSSRGSGGSFHVELLDADTGAFVSNLTGTLTIPNTGGHENWTTLTSDVTLPAGTHVLRLAIDTNSSYGSAGNFDSFQLAASSEPGPPQSLIVSTNALTVNEGVQSPFTVKLAVAPTSNVTVTISKNAGGDADLSANAATLTFTAANWNVAQTVNVLAAEDDDSVNGQATFTIASSGLTSKSVVATESDNDTATPQGLIVSHAALTVAEASKSLFTVKLATAPASNVTVTIFKNAGGDPDLAADKTTLVFTPSNWNVAQQVAVTAAADPDTANGSATFTIASSGLSSKTLLATENDDDTTRQPGTYYVNLNGNDANAGTAPDHAWQSIAKLNATIFIPGDTVLFRGEQSFNGSIYFDSSDSGTSASGSLIAPITLGSYGSGNATISAGSSFGFFAWNNGGITLQNLTFNGAGLGTNTSDGITFFNDTGGNVMQSGITVRNVTVRGFGKNGLGLGGFNGGSGYHNVEIADSQFFENRDGVTLYGPAFNPAAPAYVNQNVRVANVLAYNNHGTSGVTNPTGNGIVLGSVRDGVIERSVAHHNGANNTSKTGPVGIWAYDADRITIQHNESYANKRGTGEDGDGFDFDQNTSNSVMQYNYAHDNDGAGFLLYTGQNNGLHDNNTVRYNVSERDGRASGYGGIVIGGRVSDLDVYNNTIYFPSGAFGTDGAAVFITSIGDRVRLRNNILFTTGGARLISAPETANELLFQRNVYWPGGGATAIRWGDTVYSSVSGWLSAKTAQERVDLDNNGSLDNAALTVDPRLTSPGNGGTIGDANNLAQLSAYKLLSDSPLRDAGLDLEARYGIDPGDLDFFGTPIKQGSGFDLGADEL